MIKRAYYFLPIRNILKLVLLIDFYFLTNNIKHVNLAECLKRCLKTGQNIRTGTWFLVTAVTMFKVFNCR